MDVNNSRISSLQTSFQPATATTSNGEAVPNKFVFSTNQRLTDYLFSQTNDRERLELQHSLFRPNFVSLLKLALEGPAKQEKSGEATGANSGSTGLLTHLRRKLDQGQTLQILDAGCGEGLFLHDIAGVLEEYDRRFVDPAFSHLIGVDRDSSAVVTADEFRLLTQPPRPYLRFYQHDLTSSLENSAELRFETKGNMQFDFICLSMVLEHLPQARARLQELYEHLAPGGMIYLRDGVYRPGVGGYSSPHPVMGEVFKASSAFVLKINEGVSVANEMAGWLSDFGAELIAAKEDVLEANTQNQRGVMMLRNLVMMVQNIGPLLVKRGIYNQAEFDKMIQALFREVGAQTSGWATFVDVLARKPL